MSPEKVSPEKSKAPVLFDRVLLKARQERAVRLGAATFLLDHVANDAAERLAAVNRSFTSGIDLATPGDVLRVALEKQGVSLRPVEVAADDSAALPLASGSIDLAMSLLALQFVNDLPGVLTQVRRALKPDGLLLAAMVGGDTLTELRQAFAAAEAEVEGGASPHVSPFADLRDAGGLLQRGGFALPVTDFERLTVRYDNAFALMQDLRRMGATNVLVERRKAPSRRATLLRMAQIYNERFADPDGRIRATFDIVWLLGWAPDASQPKPLRPGSAKFILEDAVKKVGEKK
ncbi:MAG: methyltransferase domain-containing protein [Rhizobiales bacterium]|nr:methyltransferase domain-containing protein [Hyphomicrobiales bacterium]